MSRLQTALGRIRNTPGLGRDVVLVVVLLVIGTVATGYLFSRYDVITPFEERYEFTADFDQAPAVQLASRQEVRIAGVPVGKLVKAEVGDGGTARLTMSLEPGHPVYQDAHLVIRSKTPLNVMYLTLDPGTPSAGELPEGGNLPISQTDRVLQPYELLDELDPRARDALTSLVNEADVALANAPADLPPGVTALDGAVGSLQPVVEALAERRANLRHLVTSISQISTAAGQDDDRLTRLVDSLQTTLSVVSRRDLELGKSLEVLPGVTDTLRTSLKSASALITELNPTLDELVESSDRLPGTVRDLTDTVRNARDIAEKARPVVAQLRPVVDDLRPLTSDLHQALGDLTPVTSNLPNATAKLVPWLDNLGAFTYNTSSSFSLGDANGGLGRASLVLKLYDPTGGGGQ